MSFLRNVRCDVLCLFHNFRFVRIVVAMTLFTLLEFCTAGTMTNPVTTYKYVTYGTDMHQYLLVFFLAYLAYGDVAVEELEHWYVRQKLQHTGLVEWLFSKALVTFLAALLSVLLSLVGAALLLGLVKGWANTGDAAAPVLYLKDTSLGFLFVSGHPFLYMVCYGFQVGLLGGMLSMNAFFLGLASRDRIFAAASTFLFCMLYQFISVHINVDELTFLHYFSPNVNFIKWGSWWMGKCFLMAASSYVFFSGMGYLYVKRRLRCE